MARPFSFPKELPPADRLKELFVYDRETGELTWAAKPSSAPRSRWWNSVRAGKPVGSTHPGSKYLRVMIDGVHHFVHRVVWKIETGIEPGIIDHISGDGSDNRFENLRDTSLDVNMRNKALYANNTTGVAGVHFHKRDNVWTARIGVGGKQLHLGNFNSRGEAVAAVMAARVVLDYHPNHGRKANRQGTQT